MPERPTDVQRRRKSSDASYESTTPSSPPSSTPPSPDVIINKPAFVTDYYTPI